MAAVPFYLFDISRWFSGSNGSNSAPVGRWLANQVESHEVDRPREPRS
jgi:hypothetical protein